MVRFGEPPRPLAGNPGHAGQRAGALEYAASGCLAHVNPGLKSEMQAKLELPFGR